MYIEEIPEERRKCRYCYHCDCLENTVGGAYCEADIHDYIPDVETKDICCDFDYDDTFKRF